MYDRIETLEEIKKIAPSDLEKILKILLGPKRVDILFINYDSDAIESVRKTLPDFNPTRISPQSGIIYSCNGLSDGTILSIYERHFRTSVTGVIPDDVLEEMDEGVVQLEELIYPDPRHMREQEIKPEAFLELTPISLRVGYVREPSWLPELKEVSRGMGFYETEFKQLSSIEDFWHEKA